MLSGIPEFEQEWEGSSILYADGWLPLARTICISDYVTFTVHYAFSIQIENTADLYE